METPLIAIVGETGSGKSALAIRLAKQFKGELICADSWTVRKHLNIGTAKPSIKDQKLIPHHLLDIVDVCEPFSAAVFKDLANQKIQTIIGRGNLPIMVGGTGLYVDSVLYDYSFLPPSDPQLRAQLNELSLDSLHQRARSLKLDLTQVDARNKRRVIRLIENSGKLPTQTELRGNSLIIGLRNPADDLNERITARVEQMLIQGLELEAKHLSEKYGWDCEGMKGIGYKEWRGHFESGETISQVKQQIIKNTLDLAKRQRTWFKRNKSIQWVTDFEQALPLVNNFIDK